MFIYTITNIRNGKTYIGQTRRKNINARWREHKRSLNKGNYENIHLQFAWIKYGADCFEFEILDTALSIRELDIKETYYIDVLDTLSPEKGYNQRAGGTSGFILNENVKQKMSRAHSSDKDKNRMRQLGLASKGKSRFGGNCMRGHKLTQKNTYITPDGHRTCKICKRERQRNQRYLDKQQ